MGHGRHVTGSTSPIIQENTSWQAEQVPLKQLVGFQDDETWSGTGAGVVLSRDTAPENVKYGTKSLKVHIPSGITASAYCTLPTPKTLRAGIGIWVKTSVAANLTYFAVSIGDSPTTEWKLSCLTGYTLPDILLKFEDSIWRFFWLSKEGKPMGGSPWVKVSTPANWGIATNPTLNCTRVKFTMVAAGDVDVWFGNMIYQEPVKAGIVLGFDGPYTTCYTVAYPAMKARGWRGVIWAVCGNIGSSGYLTVTQINELYNNGWDICSHGYSGQTFSQSTPAATVVADMAAAQNYLRSHGWIRGSKFHSWMGNMGVSLPDVSGASAGDLAKLIFSYCRGSSEFTIPVNMFGSISQWYQNNFELWTPVNPHCLPYYATYSGSLTDFEVAFRGFLDLTIAMKTVLNTYTHRIVDFPTGSETGTAVWTALLAYLDAAVSAGTIKVITM